MSKPDFTTEIIENTSQQHTFQLLENENILYDIFCAYLIEIFNECESVDFLGPQ